MPRRRAGVEHGVGEVQAGGRCGRGGGSPRVDGLVPLGVLQRGVDVRRQRELAHGIRIAGQHPHAAPAVTEVVGHLDGQPPFVAHDGARRHLLARPDERLPAVAVGGGLEEQHLDGAAAVLAQVEAGPPHAGVVDDEQVAGLEERREVPHVAMLGRHVRPPVDQQPGGVAGFDGHLGDALGRQVVVQLVSVHGDRRRYRRSAMGLELRVDAVDGERGPPPSRRTGGPSPRRASCRWAPGAPSGPRTASTSTGSARRWCWRTRTT